MDRSPLSLLLRSAFGVTKTRECLLLQVGSGVLSRLSSAELDRVRAGGLELRLQSHTQTQATLKPSQLVQQH